MDFDRALSLAGPRAALSHTSALSLWGLPMPPDDRVHVMTGPSRRIRLRGIVAHRRCGFVVTPPTVVIRRGLPITRLEQSLVDSWPLVDRGPVLSAVADRMTTVERLRAAFASSDPHLMGRAALRALLDKLALGCRSELELWGHDRVFAGPDMPSLRRQVPVALNERTVYLDIIHEETLTNIELDGAAHHGSAVARERDLRRDAALAAHGFQVVRFSHRRLTTDPGAVRRETRAIIAARLNIIGHLNNGQPGQSTLAFVQ